MNYNYVIRLEKEEERFETEKLVRRAFWNVYREGCLEHYLLRVLREDSSFVRELNFVMEKDGALIGQAACARAAVALDGGKSLPVLTVGPICIAPEFQRHGYGKILLDYLSAEADKFGFGAIMLEGDIAFYGKSGFTYASDFCIRYGGLIDGADSSFFLCKELKVGYLSGAVGEYNTPSVYFVDEQKALSYDREFFANN